MSNLPISLFQGSKINSHESKSLNSSLYSFTLRTGCLVYRHLTMWVNYEYLYSPKPPALTTRRTSIILSCFFRVDVRGTWNAEGKPILYFTNCLYVVRTSLSHIIYGIHYLSRQQNERKNPPIYQTKNNTQTTKQHTTQHKRTILCPACAISFRVR